MLRENTEAFEAFRKVHEEYSKDTSLQEKFNEVGKPVVGIIKDYEDKLCRGSEAGGYAQYSGNLAEKFWSEVKREFPLIDRVGVVIKTAPTDTFELKKIDLV